MRTALKIEEGALFILSIILFIRTGFQWWWFPVLLFVPDIGMMGYAFNTKTGAYIYNFFHHRAVSIVLYMLGLFIGSQLIALIGIILFAHATLDRVLGFGLKYTDSFKHTHLSS